MKFITKTSVLALTALAIALPAFAAKGVLSEHSAVRFCLKAAAAKKVENDWDSAFNSCLAGKGYKIEAPTSPAK